jgi:ABC-type branched-subunit amino acid transport system substrate-binding protein
MKKSGSALTRVRAGIIAAFAAAVLVGALASCGDDDDGGTASTTKTTATAAECKGDPVTIQVIANLTSPALQQVPEVAAGAKAAAAAVTKTCQVGAPIKVEVCDEQGNPNAAGACGRKAVANKAISVVSFSGFGDNYGPPAVKAGIPIMPVAQSGSTETTSPLSFPFGNGIPLLLSQVQLAAAAGGTKLGVLFVDIPAVQFTSKLVAGAAPGFGIKSTVPVAVPVTATDMSTYVQQAISAGADSMTTIISTAPQIAIFKSLDQSGHPLTDFHGVSSHVTLTPKAIQDLGKVADGLLASSWSWSAHDESNPAIKKYLGELQAAGEKHGKLDVDMLGVSAWAAVHVIADALKEKGLTPTKENVATAMETKSMPEITPRYGLVPMDFTTNPFKDNPALAKLRIATHYAYFWQYDANGVPKSLTPEPVDVLGEKPKLELGS